MEIQKIIEITNGKEYYIIRGASSYIFDFEEKKLILTDEFEYDSEYMPEEYLEFKTEDDESVYYAIYDYDVYSFEDVLQWAKVIDELSEIKQKQ